MTKYKRNAPLSLILQREKSKENAAVRKQQIRRGRHIRRRKQQRYDALEAQGLGHYQHTGKYKPSITDSLARHTFENKYTPLDFEVAKAIGRQNGYVYGMKWAFIKFFAIWYILVIGLY